MTEEEDRLIPLDAMRGIALIATPFALTAAMGLPALAQDMPSVLGASWSDRLLWLVQSTLLDGTLRCLFALLFGAAMLMAVDRAEMDGRDSRGEQRRRLLLLGLFGIVDHLLLWNDDPLLPLALAGLLASRMIGRETIDLVKWALAFIGLNWLIALIAGLLPFWGSSSEAFAIAMQREWFHDLAVHTQGPTQLLIGRLQSFVGYLLNAGAVEMPQLTGFILLGMAMARSGFFSGHWDRAAYRRSALHAYAVGLIPLLAMGLWALNTQDPRIGYALFIAATPPFRIPVAIAHAALIASLSAPAGPLATQLAAIGRKALSGYFACAAICALLFQYNGWMLYGTLSRLQLTGLAIIIAAALILLMRLARKRQSLFEHIWRGGYRRA